MEKSKNSNDSKVEKESKLENESKESKDPKLENEKLALEKQENSNDTSNPVGYKELVILCDEIKWIHEGFRLKELWLKIANDGSMELQKMIFSEKRLEEVLEFGVDKKLLEQNEHSKRYERTHVPIHSPKKPNTKIDSVDDLKNELPSLPNYSLDDYKLQTNDVKESNSEVYELISLEEMTSAFEILEIENEKCIEESWSESEINGSESSQKKEPTENQDRPESVIKNGSESSQKKETMENQKSGSSEHKAEIEITDMSEEMSDFAIDTVTQALKKYNIVTDIATYIKYEFDEKYKPSWHCIVGRYFGCFVSYEPGTYMFLKVGNIFIVIYKS